MMSNREEFERLDETKPRIAMVCMLPGGQPLGGDDLPERIIASLRQNGIDVQYVPMRQEVGMPWLAEAEYVLVFTTPD